VNELLADETLAGRMRAGAEAIRSDPGREKAATLLERLAATGEPVT
jgi:UDP:flavonoid glycosyltransferase YjiC (YdhE family)